MSYGIVLHSLRYGDNQLIVDVFTASSGVVPFLVRISRNRRSGPKASAWQALALVEVNWVHRPQSHLQKPRELTLWKPWRSLSSEPYKAAMSLFLSEFLFHALRKEQENPEMFDYLVNALSWFDEAEEHYVNFHIVLLLHLTRFLGFLPNVDDWHEGCYFDLDAASFASVRPSHKHFLEPDEASLVPKFLRMNLRSMQAVGLNHDIRRRALDIVTEYYRLHIPEFPELKSLDVLSEVFA